MSLDKPKPSTLLRPVDKCGFTKDSTLEPHPSIRLRCAPATQDAISPDFAAALLSFQSRLDWLRGEGNLPQEPARKSSRRDLFSL
jgi:hypothetical protein